MVMIVTDGCGCDYLRKDGSNQKVTMAALLDCLQHLMVWVSMEAFGRLTFSLHSRCSDEHYHIPCVYDQLHQIFLRRGKSTINNL